MDKIQSAKELFVDTLKEMDSEYEVWHDKDSSFESIVFDYQTVKWRAK